MKMTEIGSVVAIPDGSIKDVTISGDSVTVVIEEYTEMNYTFTFSECYLIEYLWYTYDLDRVEVLQNDERLTQILHWNFDEDLEKFPEIADIYIVKFFGVNDEDVPVLSIIASKVAMTKDPYLND